MKTKILRSIFITVGVLFTLIGSVAADTFITFDVPGSVGTGPVSINPAGTIAGSYADDSLVDHGFVRAVNGAITSFDLPGSIFTTPTGINPKGTITGSYIDDNFVVHGFVRALNGRRELHDSRFRAGCQWHFYDVRSSRLRVYNSSRHQRGRHDHGRLR